ncbi:type VII secretion protein EssC [Mollicutes bacterium LVI A0078]|nr:type VII secretion protein EssC [Mollicutes bacterium LVI A0075]WOO91880.1 type VII secretion protein EssC [Mollicutes bacterium LVI A0078]
MYNHKQITNMPLVIDAKKNIGLVGNRYVISKQMKNILMQSIFNHSYLDLQIIVITDDTYLDDYQYAFSMAHFKDSEKVHNYFVHNSITRDQYLNGFTQVLRQRDMEYKQGMVFDKHLLFIIDNPALINNHPIREFLEKPEERLGMSQIQVAKASNELPKHIKTTIDYKTETRAQLILEKGKLVNNEFILPSVDSDKAELELYYRRLSNLEHIKGIKSAVPDQLGFLEMYEVSNPKELQIASRWNKNKTYKSLAALLGKKSETDYIYLDLHEKIHGPHGLVAGTTGSGKSEVIQTYILSLAIEYSPEQVGFLLIDYKGGGMANLFKDMPHHLGSITNLDGYQSMRALASIKSELKRRQQIFSDNNVNHINNYTKLYEAGQVQEPLPHLFLISDEFAELKAEQPDFMKELVSAARIGRSLGIHLILATQKPDGVVDDQIWSNSKFKLSLKVAEEADSKALLKTPDAAYITNPGRGYLKVGTNELYELFQSGYSGAPYSTNAISTAKPEIYELDIYGNQTIINPEECTTEQEQEGIAATELDVVLEEIDNTYNTSKLTEVSKPWLPPLEDFMYTEYEKSNNHAKLNVNLGLIDLPNAQNQIEFIHDFVSDGTLAIIGSAASGKTNVLLRTILSLSHTNTPKDINLFVFDFANNGLIQVKDLKHTSEYITLSDALKVQKFISEIKEEINIRKNLMSRLKVSNFKLYNDISDDKMQSYFIFIDNYAQVNEFDTEFKKMLHTLIKEGANLGIYIVISAFASKDVKPSVLLEFKRRVLLNTADQSEVTTVLKKTNYPISAIPGRALLEVDEIEVCQLYSALENRDENKKIEELKNVIEKINKNNITENRGFQKMPDQIDYKLHFVRNKLYIGKLYSNLKNAFIPVSNILIDGPNVSGKTNLLKIIIEQLIVEEEITIIDDTSFSLLEYSDTSKVDYLTNPQDIKSSSKYVIINKMSRIEKIPRKELITFYEKIFLMSLNGTKFIVETGAKGIGNGKEDFIQLMKSAPYYIYFDNPNEQNLYNVSKELYKKEITNFGDAYLFNSKGVNKLKIPMVVTGNEEKEFVIPDLKKLGLGKGLEVDDFAVLGSNNKKYIEKLVTSNSNLMFKIIDTTNKFKINETNVQHISLEELDKITATDIVINNDLEELQKIPNKERTPIIEKIDKLACKSFITVFNEKTKIRSERIKKYKNNKKFILTSNPNDEQIQDIFKINNRKLLELEISENEIIQMKNKIIEKIRM